MKTVCAALVLISMVLASSAAFAQNEYYVKGLKYYDHKDFTHAVEYLDRYVAMTPDPAAYYLLGYASYKLKKFEQANRYFKEAYLIDPTISAKMINRTGEGR